MNCAEEENRSKKRGKKRERDRERAKGYQTATNNGRCLSPSIQCVSLRISIHIHRRLLNTCVYTQSYKIYTIQVYIIIMLYIRGHHMYIAAGIILIFCARRSDDQPVVRRRRRRRKKKM